LLFERGTPLHELKAEPIIDHGKCPVAGGTMTAVKRWLAPG
jgi:hypothetical protein